MSLNAIAAYGSSSSDEEDDKNCSNALKSCIIKKGKKLKILAPKKIKYESSDDEDYGAPPTKKSNISKVSSQKSSTSGLFSKLPAPNSSFGGIKSTSSLMMPYVLTKKKTDNIKKKTTKPKQVVEKKVIDKDSDDEAEVPFFSFHEKSEVDNQIPVVLESQNVQQTCSSITKDNDDKQQKSDKPIFSNSYPQNSYNVPYSFYEYSEDKLSSSYSPQAPVHEPKPEDDWLNSKEYKKFLGKNSKEKIDFIDVNADDALEGNKQMLLANLTKEASMQRQSHSKKIGGPTARQKSKHQLSYLIHQAKANEIQLQEQWAAGKAKRDAARMRYGF